MREDTENRILNVAQKLFSHYGLKNTRIDDITKNAQISKATFYNYFDKKEEIFFIILKMEAENLWFKVESSVKSESDPYRKLRVFFISKIKAMRETVNLLNMQAENIDFLHPIIKELLKENFKKELKLVREIITYGIDRGVFVVEDLDLTVYIIVRAIQGLEKPWVIEDMEVDINNKVDILLKMLYFGLTRK